MRTFKSLYIILSICCLKSNNIELICEKIDRLIPSLQDLNNNNHEFFKFFKNQALLTDAINTIKSLNFQSYTIVNNDIFNQCDTYLSFFQQILYLKKYLLIYKAIINPDLGTLPNTQSQVTSKQLILQQHKEQKHLIKKGEFLQEKIASTLLSGNAKHEISCHILYIDYILDIEHLNTKNKIYQMQIKSTKLITQKNSSPPQKLIFSLIIASISMLTYYLFLTQTREFCDNYEF